MHIVQFTSADDFAAYRASNSRTKFAQLLEKSGAEVSVHEVTDIS